MKLSISPNKKYRILIPTVFILMWLINLTWDAGDHFACLFWGLLSLLCLWEQPPVPDSRAVRLPLYLLSFLMSFASIILNLSLFEPVASLLSAFNMAMSLVGGGFASFFIMLWLLSPRKKAILRSSRILLEALSIFLWAALLLHTDSRYAVYVFCAVAGVTCACHNRDRDTALSGKTKLTLALFAALFSLAVVLANYPLFTPLLTPSSLVRCVFCLLGGFFTGFQVLLAMMLRLPLEPASAERCHPMGVFSLTFFGVSAISMAFLFSSCYPGLLTQDSVSTVEQILGLQPFNNTMPYWHTVTVQPFLLLGYHLWGTVEAGIALFHCAQVLFMAACFGAVITTLYQIGVPTLGLLAVAFFYACIPYNIVYSVSLWKDVPFAGAALLFVTGLYRLINHIGSSRKLNYCIFIVGAIGFSLWRTNGWYAFAVTFIVMALVAGKKHRKRIILMALVLILCWVLIHPVLDILGVSETNLVEAFAVPMQQVARVIANHRPLSQEQTDLLSGIFWLNTTAKLYDPLSVDPIKFNAFRSDNIHLITENPLAYLRLYFQLGIQYPADYLKAWVDETKGYWNGGYDYWHYSMGHYQEIANPVDKLFTSAFRFLNDTETFKLLSSVGLYVWGMIGCCLINALKKREEFLLSIPSLVLVMGLWLGTPVFCEFRYAYPLVLTLPLVVCLTLYKKRNAHEQGVHKTKNRQKA